MADYPAYRYHPAQGTRLVNSVEEDKALGDGWFNNPTFTPPAKAAVAKPEPKPEPELVRKAGESQKAFDKRSDK